MKSRLAALVLAVVAAPGPAEGAAARGYEIDILDG